MFYSCNLNKRLSPFVSSARIPTGANMYVHAGDKKWLILENLRESFSSFLQLYRVLERESLKSNISQMFHRCNSAHLFKKSGTFWTGPSTRHHEIPIGMMWPNKLTIGGKRKCPNEYFFFPKFPKNFLLFSPRYPLTCIVKLMVKIKI